MDPNYGITLAEAPQIVEPAAEGVAKFVGYITENDSLSLACTIIGAIFIVICIVLLVIRRFWPQTPIGQSLNAGNSTVVWCIAGMIAGIIFILPGQILPFLTKIVMTGVQAILNICSRIFNF